MIGQLVPSVSQSASSVLFQPSNNAITGYICALEIITLPSRNPKINSRGISFQNFEDLFVKCEETTRCFGAGKNT